MTAAPLCGGIIAAGDGTRLRQAGFSGPKPLVPIAGVPLIAGVINNFLAAGITRLVIIVNDDARNCVDRVRERFPGADITFVVKTTRSSLESFLEVGRRLGRGRALISTVDAWCRPADFVRFVDAAMRRGDEANVLAVTPLVDDEKPLWVNIDADGRVKNVGGQPGALVTAGMYVVTERVRTATPPSLARLRDFLAWLVEQGEPVYAETIETVVDVDRAADVALAEALASRGGSK